MSNQTQLNKNSMLKESLVEKYLRSKKQSISERKENLLRELQDCKDRNKTRLLLKRIAEEEIDIIEEED